MFEEKTEYFTELTFTNDRWKHSRKKKNEISQNVSTIKI